MKSDIINGLKSKIAKISYQEDSRDHILFGYIIEETKDSLIIKSDDFENNIVIPKKKVTMLFWPKDMSTTPIRSPVEKKRSKHFSYAKWWKYDDVKEAEP